MANQPAGTLPLAQRSKALRYANEEGTVGATAYPINYDEVYNLKGRVLTVIDATFPDPTQRKAMKDIMWGEIRRWMDEIVRVGEADGEVPRPPAI